MSRPVHFEIQASDPQRAIRFYQQLFGWQFTEYVPNVYWLITTGETGTPGIDGGLGFREAPMAAAGTSANAFVCIIDVPSIDETIAAVKKAGCEITNAKHAVPGVGWLFYFVDTEGNSVGAMQSDGSAA